MRVLEQEVIPLFYDRDSDGLPHHWIHRMMNSISSLAWRFSSHRMVADYVTHCYLPAAGGFEQRYGCAVNRSRSLCIVKQKSRANTPRRS